MKHFLDRSLDAFNATRIPVDPRIVAEFSDLASLPGRLIGIAPEAEMWKSDIEWISADDEQAFGAFETAFERLGIGSQAAPFLDFDREVRLFSGFLVVRSRCSETYFHSDWHRLNNEAFTVLTPVTSNTSDFGLLYKKTTGEVGDYAYRSGEAILFGDNFKHSTKPGRSDRPVVLLCFQFGSDRMKYWDAISAQMSTQVTVLKRGDGTLIRTGRPPTRVVKPG